MIRETIETKARRLGLYATIWRPGDGVTRYRLHATAADYHDGSHLATCLGRAEAHVWLNGYAAGRATVSA